MGYLKQNTKKKAIRYFSVVGPATWSMNVNEVGDDLALIQTFLLFSSNCKLVSIRTT